MLTKQICQCAVSTERAEFSCSHSLHNVVHEPRFIEPEFLMPAKHTKCDKNKFCSFSGIYQNIASQAEIVNSSSSSTVTSPVYQQESSALSVRRAYSILLYVITPTSALIRHPHNAANLQFNSNKSRAISLKTHYFYSLGYYSIRYKHTSWTSFQQKDCFLLQADVLLHVEVSLQGLHMLAWARWL